MPPTAFVPAVPKVFESKKQVTDEWADANSAVRRAIELSGDNPAVLAAKSPVEAPQTAPSDWASLAVEENEEGDTTETGAGASSIPNTRDLGTRKLAIGGSIPLPAHYQESLSHNDEAALTPQTIPTKSSKAIFGAESVLSVRSPKDSTPLFNVLPRHSSTQLSKITFGSFEISSDSVASSPVLPPSTTSTHQTEGTPLSDAHTESSTRRDGAGGQSETSTQGHHYAGLGYSVASGPTLIPTHHKFEEASTEALRRSVLQCFMRGDGDLRVTVTIGANTQSWIAWRFIAARSANLALSMDEALQNKRFDASGRLVVNVTHHSRYVTFRAIDATLKALHGDRLVHPDTLLQIQTQPRLPLELMAAARFFGEERMVMYGVTLVDAVLTSADAIRECFAYCCEGFRWEYGGGQAPELTALNLIIPSNIKLGGSHVLFKTLNGLIRELNERATFFRLDLGAPYIEQLQGGFPAASDGVQMPPGTGDMTSTWASRGIATPTFGSVDFSAAMDINTVLSSVLFSLPLVILQHVMSNVRDLPLVNLVVAEREHRRKVALTVNPQNQLAMYEEQVVAVPGLNGKRFVSRRV